MRVIRAAGAALLLAALLLGIPWLLLAAGDPGHLLEVDWRTALFVAVDSRLVLAVLSVIGWIAWAVLALAVAAEAVAVVSRQRIRLTLPGTAWLRPAIAALVAAAAAAPTVAAAEPGPVAQRSAGEAAAPVPVVAHDAPGSPASAGTRDYVVRQGDELWTIAERELGAGELWRAIVELNPGLGQQTGLAPGTTLRLPAPPQDTTIVTVEPGDTLWSIAEDELGDPERWPEIHAANTDIIEHPDVIDVGWRLVVPGAGDAPPPADPQPGAHGIAVAADAPSAPAAPPAQASPASPPDEHRPAADVTASVAPEARVTPRSAPPQAEVEVSAQPADDPTDALLGSLGALTAAGVAAGLATRRRLQILGRAAGRRLIPGSDDLMRFWSALAGRAQGPARLPAHPGPTAIVLGWSPEGAPVVLDLEAHRVTALVGPDAEAALAAAITGLACGPWAADVTVSLVEGRAWAEALDDPRVTAVATIEEGLAELSRLCAARRLAMGSATLAGVRADPETAGAYAPTVVVFPQPLTPAQQDSVTDALALGEVGVSVLLASSQPPHIRAALVEVAGSQARWGEEAFTPQLLARPAARALLDLFHLTGTPDTDPAPWWPEEPGNVTPLPLHSAPEESTLMPAPPQPPDHPTLLLLGDVFLDGAAGTRPTRAVGQCLEYCAWLLEHPGTTPSAMTRALLVAETTRRSNVSRLRSWLGTAPDGANYLPDAYSGRVALDERVTSDWEHFRALLSGGLPVAADHSLIAALRLVRGEPLGSFAFQWVWAEQMRTDMIAMIVDTACVLADRAIERRDGDLALWAVERGRLAAADDDELAAREVVAQARSGRWAEAERATLRLTRAARAAGRDLAPDLARRIQLALNSAPARRAAPLAD